jgi:hypothetical protein
MQPSTTDDQPQHGRRPSLQMYDKAFDVYAEAYLLTNDWYVGINAATLALLSGRQELAEQYARDVAATCSIKLDHDTKNRYWLFATEGEAALILDDTSSAVAYYGSALNQLTPSQSGMANSSYQQMVRLWKHFAADGDERVGPVLQMFEQSDFRDFLNHGFLGRNFK